MTAIIYAVTDIEHPVTKYIRYLSMLTAGITTVCPRYTINYTSFRNSINGVIPNVIIFNFILDPDDQDIEVNIQIDMLTKTAEILYDHDTTTAVFITDDDVSVIFEHINLKFRDSVIGDYVVCSITEKQRKKLDKLVRSF